MGIYQYEEAFINGSIAHLELNRNIMHSMYCYLHLYIIPDCFFFFFLYRLMYITRIAVFKSNNGLSTSFAFSDVILQNYVVLAPL